MFARDRESVSAGVGEMGYFCSVMIRGEMDMAMSSWKRSLAA